jgi:IstB-like ATP binding protein
VIGEPTFADAILDRIVHNAYRLALDGPSMRKIQAAEQEAAVPVVDTTNSTNATTAKLAKGTKK